MSTSRLKSSETVWRLENSVLTQKNKTQICFWRGATDPVTFQNAAAPTRRAGCDAASTPFTFSTLYVRYNRICNFELELEPVTVWWQLPQTHGEQLTAQVLSCVPRRCCLASARVARRLVCLDAARCDAVLENRFLNRNAPGPMHMGLY